MFSILTAINQEQVITDLPSTIFISQIFAFLDSRKIFYNNANIGNVLCLKVLPILKIAGDVRVNISCPRVQTEMAGLLPETIAVFIKN